MSDPTTPSTALDIPEAKRLRTSNEELEYVEDSALSEALKSQDSTVSIQTGSALSASAIDDTAKTADADKHITEEQVGILQYISPYLTGFTGIIKDR
jgi:hypothetical protein